MLAGIATLAALVWLLGNQFAQPAGEGTIPTRDVASRAEEPFDAKVLAPNGAPTLGGAEQSSTMRTAAAPSQPSHEGPGPFLRVCLRGLHPSLPWTTALHLRCEGHDGQRTERLVHEANAEPNRGNATFDLPSWVTTSLDDGAIDAADPNYLPLHHRWEGALDLSRVLWLDVQVSAAFEGRVVDQRGGPVRGASVAAFRLQAGTPVDGWIHETTTDESGRYTLVVPTATSLCLLATPKWRVDPSGTYQLLPVRKDAVSGAGMATKLDDLVLPDAAMLTGIVRWSDGRPVDAARVWVLPRGGVMLTIGSECGQMQRDGSLSPRTSTFTAEDGTFELPAVPGADVDVALATLLQAEVVGDWLTHQATAPQHIEITVPGPLKLRAVQNGAPVAHAKIDIEGLQPETTDESGEVLLVTTLPKLRVRATAGAVQSAWTEVTTTAPHTIDLELAPVQGELAIEFEGEVPVRNVHFTWTRDGGDGGRQSLERSDSKPFRLHLQPGRYRLRIAAAGDRSGLFLLPIERDVDVSTVPQSLTLQARYGGRFTVHATDGSGFYVRGTCRVLDAAGTDRTSRFVTHNADRSGNVGNPGELMEGGPNEHSENLVAGEYLLEFDFPDHGTQQQRVTIRPREIVEVRIRLP
ncbi:MAG: carboxypeptidase-like regulatory domain-containing protein [Planctomycetota bacterium]